MILLYVNKLTTGSGGDSSIDLDELKCKEINLRLVQTKNYLMLMLQQATLELIH